MASFFLRGHQYAGAFLRRGAALLLALTGAIGSGCVGLRSYNQTRAEYLRHLDTQGGIPADLAIIEFDDQGQCWDLAQLEDTLDLIKQQSGAASNGVLVVVYIHGWKHNADWSREKGNLRVFAEQIRQTAEGMSSIGRPSCERVIGVYIAWRGDSMRWPLRQLSFWGRRAAAERLASINMRESLFRLIHAVKTRPQSKVVLYGHSMGGMVLGKTMAPSLTTLLMLNQGAGTRLPVDLVVLANPAIDALTVSDFVRFLKRHKAELQMEAPDGTRHPASGPLIVSVTSEADSATGSAFPFGMTLTAPFKAYRPHLDKTYPSQRYLATHTDGHVDALVSHTAEVRDGRVVLSEVPGRFNDTPCWVIRVSREVCANHGDIGNPHLNQLLADLTRMREVYDRTLVPVMVLRGEESP